MIWLAIILIACLVMLVLARPWLTQMVTAYHSGYAAFTGQREELRRDRELGLLSDDELRQAEMDIERRALAAKAQGAAGEDWEEGETGPVLPGLVLLTVMSAVGLYLWLGQPQWVGPAPVMPIQQSQSAQTAATPREPDMPEEARQQLAALEADLAANPDQPDSWAFLGHAYLALGQADAAVAAFRQAVLYDPETASHYASLGQGLLVTSRNEFTPEILTAFGQALDLDPLDVRASFFVGEAAFRMGDYQAAMSRWQDIVNRLDESDPYFPIIQSRLDMAQQLLEQAPTTSE